MINSNQAIPVVEMKMNFTPVDFVSKAITHISRSNGSSDRAYNIINPEIGSSTHSPEQINQLRSSLREFGFINPVIIDRDFGVIAGHGRILAAKEEGIAEPEKGGNWNDLRAFKKRTALKRKKSTSGALRAA